MRGIGRARLTVQRLALRALGTIPEHPRITVAQHRALANYSDAGRLPVESASSVLDSTRPFLVGYDAVGDRPIA